ncbi:sodium:phosphate symporter [Haloarchaeobius sp. HRN-SO-5]|uniref:sodium:phosphate symporter n=1 Tax=Haloarchaeobius sp. HRN-SO-5 TaxID=3446118 RepID=UPI003EBAC5A5
MSSRLSRAFDRFSGASLLSLGIAGAVLVFLFAVQLLGTATEAAAPVLERVFARVVVGDASALGIGWFGAYLLANGSVVAALSLSLFTADIVSPSQLFMMIAGSRLGSAVIVVVVGALDYFQKERYTLRRSVSMGLLTFLLTHSIYVPVTVLGYVALTHLRRPVGAVGPAWVEGLQPLTFFDPVTAAVTDAIGPGPTFVLAVALLFGSLKLFDRFLGSVDTRALRRRFFRHLERTWLSFVIGLLVTTVTTSVAFSIGVIVPLYNRGYVERDELIPYVLGANLGTLFDTLVVAVVLRSPAGVAVVLELLVVATLVTLVALVAIDAYSDAVVAVDDRLLDDRRLFVAFVLALVLVPLGLLVVPLAVG